MARCNHVDSRRIFRRFAMGSREVEDGVILVFLGGMLSWTYGRYVGNFQHSLAGFDVGYHIRNSNRVP